MVLKKELMRSWHGVSIYKGQYLSAVFYLIFLPKSAETNPHVGTAQFVNKSISEHGYDSCVSCSANVPDFEKKGGALQTCIDKDDENWP